MLWVVVYNYSSEVRPLAFAADLCHEMSLSLMVLLTGLEDWRWLLLFCKVEV